MPYIDSITVAQKIRAKYHHKSQYKPFNIHGKVLGKRLSTNLYRWDEEGYIVNLEGVRVIANPKKAGEPRKWVINGQAIYNGTIKHHVRNNYLNKIKELITPWIVEDVYPIIEFPLQIELFIFANEMSVDCDNKGYIYHKIFQDILVINRIIPDDNSKFIQDTGRTKWIPTPKHKEKMEFHITKIE